MIKLSGHCLCGAVTWSYHGPKMRNLICHCESCQRATSSPFAAFVGCDPSGLKINGRVNNYESQPNTWRGFCHNCGSRMYFKSSRWPGEIHMHAGTLDDRDAYVPDQQVMYDERAAWSDTIPAVQEVDTFGKKPS